VLTSVIRDIRIKGHMPGETHMKLEQEAGCLRERQRKIQVPGTKAAAQKWTLDFHSGHPPPWDATFGRALVSARNRKCNASTLPPSIDLVDN
jgi:hypothetical protein